MKYFVRYKLKSQWFWRTIKNVTGDASFISGDKDHLPYRVFFLEDHSRVELPMEGTQFKFGPGRHFTILKNMEKESGQRMALGE